MSSLSIFLALCSVNTIQILDVWRGNYVFCTLFQTALVKDSHRKEKSTLDTVYQDSTWKKTCVLIPYNMWLICWMCYFVQCKLVPSLQLI